MVTPAILQPGGPWLNNFMLEWCAQRLGEGMGFPVGAVAIGVGDTDTPNDLLAVAVFDNFRRSRDGKPLSIECSIAAASPRWANKSTIRAILSYPFCQLNVQRVTAMVKKSNERSQKMLKRLGFVEEGFVRHALDNEEGIYVTGMLREESRKWLGSLLDG